MTDFTFVSDELALPTGAWAKTHRRWLRHGDTPVLALSASDFRNYVYPLFSPAGYLVTSESPADHPHHNSLWIGSDHVHAQVPVDGGRVEEYTYNFYVNETFQGRAPGRIIELSCQGGPVSGAAFRIVQDLDWRGPAEWAAPEGRSIAREMRTLTVTPGARATRIDVQSELRATRWDLHLGPTRHAYFNIRVAESMIVANGGLIQTDCGAHDACGGAMDVAQWVDFTGPVGGEETAGVTILPHPLKNRENTWFVADWGVVTVGPFRARGTMVTRDEPFICGYTVIVHDGPFESAFVDTDV